MSGCGAWQRLAKASTALTPRPLFWLQPTKQENKYEHLSYMLQQKKNQPDKKSTKIQQGRPKNSTRSAKRKTMSAKKYNKVGQN